MIYCCDYKRRQCLKIDANVSFGHQGRLEAANETDVFASIVCSFNNPACVFALWLRFLIYPPVSLKH